MYLNNRRVHERIVRIKETVGCLFSSLLRSICKKKKRKNSRKIFSRGYQLLKRETFLRFARKEEEEMRGIKEDGMRQAVVNFNDVVLFLIGAGIKKRKK